LILLILSLLLGLFLSGFYCSIQALRWLVNYVSAAYQVQAAILSPPEAILSIMQLTLLFMLIVSAPALLLFVIRYVRPALYDSERRILMYVPVSLGLGVLGSLFGLYLALNIFLPYFNGFSQLLGAQNIWALERLSGFVISNMFIFFLLFQTPLVILFLHGLGWLKTTNLTLLRKVVLIVALIAGAIVTPPDVASQIIVALPIYLLVELSIQYCRCKEKLARRRSQR
jgi:sec-independent protein translocase protein TatC